MQEIESKHTSLIEQKKSTLIDEISQLEYSIKIKKAEAEKQIQSELANLKHRLENLPRIQSNLVKEFITDFKKNILKVKIWDNERTFDKRLNDLVQESADFLANNLIKKTVVINLLIHILK